jgi:hypothetical protein
MSNLEECNAADVMRLHGGTITIRWPLEPHSHAGQERRAWCLVAVHRLEP